jgi:hypothetical protein
MTQSLAAFQSGLGLALRGEGTAPIDPDSSGLRFTAAVRRSWCEGRAMIAARAVMALLPAAERKRLTAEYVDQGGGLAMFLPTENAAFLAFLAERLPDPSHALSLCRMDQALARARLGAETFVPPPIEHTVRKCMEHEAWGCIEDAILEPVEGDVWECMGHTARKRVEYQAWGCIETAILETFESDIWERMEFTGRRHVELSPIRPRIECGPHAALVWFHADPGLVLRALYGAPAPSVGAASFPLFFAPGLPHLYRAATEEEVALWAALPNSENATPELIERLLTEGIVVYMK